MQKLQCELSDKPFPCYPADPEARKNLRQESNLIGIFPMCGTSTLYLFHRSQKRFNVNRAGMAEREKRRESLFFMMWVSNG